MMRYQDEAMVPKGWDRLNSKALISAFAICFLLNVPIAFSQNAFAPRANDSVAAIKQEVPKIQVNEASAAKDIEMADQELMNAEKALLESLTARAKASAAPSKPNTEQAAPAVANDSQVARTTQPVVVKEAAAPAVDSKAMLNADARAVQAFQVQQNVPQAAQVAPSTKEQAATVTQVSDNRPIANVSDAASNEEAFRLKQQLAAANNRINSMMKDLDSMRGKLAIAETEVSRLSSLVDAKSRSNLNKYSLPETTRARLPQGQALSRPVAQQQQVAQPQVALQPARMPQAPAQQVKLPETGRDLPVATVSVEKAELRLGPGKNHSSLMSLTKGSRLVVEARQGEWYRVFAPNGERAWVNSQMVVFGEAASPMNDSSASRVRGYDVDAEDNAFRNMNRQTGVK